MITDVPPPAVTRAWMVTIAEAPLAMGPSEQLTVVEPVQLPSVELAATSWRPAGS